MTDPISQILLTTADRFETGEYYWAQGDRKTRMVPENCACIETGLYLTAESGNKFAGYVPALDRIKRVVQSSPWRWNDTPGRTLPEVISALRKAAAL